MARDFGVDLDSASTYLDSDGDGLHDDYDDCPYEYSSPSNMCAKLPGCPASRCDSSDLVTEENVYYYRDDPNDDIWEDTDDDITDMLHDLFNFPFELIDELFDFINYGIFI